MASTEPTQPPFEARTIVPVPNNVPYIVAVIAMVVSVIAGIVTITLVRPSQDNLPVIAALIGFATPTLLSLLAFMKAQETHLSVNSRLDAFMLNARLAAHAQGVTEGRAEGRQSADRRTDVLAEKAATTPKS